MYCLVHVSGGSGRSGGSGGVVLRIDDGGFAVIEILLRMYSLLVLIAYSVVSPADKTRVEAIDSHKDWLIAVAENGEIE